MYMLIVNKRMDPKITININIKSLMVIVLLKDVMLIQIKLYNIFNKCFGLFNQNSVQIISCV